MPPFVQVMKACDTEFRTVLFQNLGQIIARVRQHIKDYLPDIFSLIQDYWQPFNLVHIIGVIEEISSALSDEFKLYIPNLLPKILSVGTIGLSFTSQVLHHEHESHEAVIRALHALIVFGNNLEDYIHLVIPAVVKICEYNDAPQKSASVLRSHALNTLIRLSLQFNVSNQASRILNPLIRLLDVSAPDLQPTILQAILVIAKQLGES